ncbi:MAG: serine/threonine protein kinase [Gammaproteobacteria bacterium]
MPVPSAAPARTQLLKSDLFGRILLVSPSDTAPYICRDMGAARWWVRPLARALARREARILRAASSVEGVPRLLHLERNALHRSYLDGAPMHQAKPADPAYFVAAQRLLFRLHRAGVVHNDTAKEPNWLVRPDGRPALIDFQLAGISARRRRFFRLLAREDVRHMLKHKRTYVPEKLTSRQRAILARPAWTSRVWMATVKPVYLFITRRIFRWSDREGASDRGSGVGRN